MKFYLTKVGISVRDLDLGACIGLGGMSAFNILDQCLLSRCLPRNFGETWAFDILDQ